MREYERERERECVCVSVSVSVCVRRGRGGMLNPHKLPGYQLTPASGFVAAYLLFFSSHTWFFCFFPSWGMHDMGGGLKGGIVLVPLRSV
jgi:hypothetical protein